MNEYLKAKNIVLEYIKDRNEYLKIYNDIECYLNGFKKVTKPYDYIPKEFVYDFISQLETLINEHAELFKND